MFILGSSAGVRPYFVFVGVTFQGVGSLLYLYSVVSVRE
jgi:hypothetical protein